MRGFIKELKYSFYLMFHPFKGFWEIKNEGAGTLRTAFVLLILFVLAMTANGLYAGYIFNPSGGIFYDVFKGILIILVLYFGWCISNWCLTCLFDGEGSFTDILKATAYALTPLTLMQIILIPLSYMLSLREAAIYTFISTLGTLWFAFLLFASTIVTHQYTVFKTVLMIACVILGMCILAYIALLFFNLIGQMVGFIEVIIKELQNRA